MSNSSLIDRIEQFCLQQGLLFPDQRIVIGLSGGADSLFLLHVLATLRPKYNLTLWAAHLDHGWRATSGQDVVFCDEIARKYSIPLISEHASAFVTQVPKKNGSLEALGRSLRRAFFAQVAQETGAHAIALAHHQDDQFETFFIRLFRGASVTGLCGMKPQDGLFIRPLLCCRRAEIETALQQEDLAWLQDSTNEDRRFLRNRIRHDLLPVCRTCDGRFGQTLTQTMDQLSQASSFLDELVAERYQKIIRQDERFGVMLVIEHLLGEHAYMQRALLLRWLIEHKVPFTPSNGLLDEIVRFLNNTKSVQHQLAQNWRVGKKKRMLFLEHEINRIY